MEAQSRLSKAMATGSEEPYLITKKKIRYWFGIINEDIFENMLTNFTKVTITEDLHTGRKIFAECECCYDVDGDLISNLEMTDEFTDIRLFLNVLGHEMVHLWESTYKNTMTHSKKTFFGPWKAKFAEHGMTLAKVY